jgi:GntR family transcriptional regulator, transcriptional repressor for pyruvate dehydrogenase complex
MLSAATVEGRSLTPVGEEQLKRAEEEQHIQVSTEKLLLSLRSGSRKDLIDQLVVRRAIEGESAALAAQNASSVSLATLQEALEDQRRAIVHGRMGVDEDIRFHEAIAQESGNSVLVSMTHLLRSHPWLNHVINAIRTKVGGRRIVDHEEIMSAIKRHDAALARQAMHRHITRIIDDVDRYWEQVFSDLGAQGEEIHEDNIG